MFTDFLYRLTPRDQSSQGLILANRQIDTTANAIAVTSTIITVPLDQIFLVNVLAVNAVAPAGVTPVRCRAFMISADSGQSVDILYDQQQTLGAGVFKLVVGASWPIIVPPNWFIDCQVEFSAANPANRLLARMNGMFAPRGNLSLP